MMVSDILASAQFVVNEGGERTAVLLDIAAWQQLVQWATAHAVLPAETPPPVQNLDELWGDFWPDDEPVDTFIDAVRQWRQEDPSLHRELS